MPIKVYSMTRINPRACIRKHVYKKAAKNANIGKGHLSKKEDKDQESIQSSTTPDPGYQWEWDNFTIRHHKRGPRGQPFFPAGDHKESINRRA